MEIASPGAAVSKMAEIIDAPLTAQIPYSETNKCAA
jgi:hypothetical protein